MESFMDNFNEMVDSKTIKELIDSKKIVFEPIAYLRGRTFRKSFIICDEMQNADIKQLMTIVTRLGSESKMVFIGDGNQNDINEKLLALDFFIRNILTGNDFFHFKFDRNDIVRDPILIKIIDNYEFSKIYADFPKTKRSN